MVQWSGVQIPVGPLFCNTTKSLSGDLFQITSLDNQAEISKQPLKGRQNERNTSKSVLWTIRLVLAYSVHPKQSREVHGYRKWRLLALAITDNELENVGRV